MHSALSKVWNRSMYGLCDHYQLNTRPRNQANKGGIKLRKPTLKVWERKENCSNASNSKKLCVESQQRIGDIRSEYAADFGRTTMVPKATEVVVITIGPGLLEMREFQEVWNLK